MDIKDSSAMTEASGIANEETGAGTRRADAAVDSSLLHFNSRQAAERLAERLRDVTVKAPLQALFAAFVLGVWVARRR